jgi:hypothetical protein
MPVPLGGYAGRRGAPATGVQTLIFARALVVTRQMKKAALVSADLCFLPANIKAAVAQRLVAAGITDLPADSLFLAATHTHTAPDPLAMHTGNRIADLKGWPRFEMRLLDFTVERIAGAIVEANRRLAPALLGSTMTQAGHLNQNRRGDPITDGELTALKITGLDGKVRAAVINYAAHPTLYDEKMMAISPDWPGVMTERLERVFGKETVCLFMNGAEGDARPKGAEGTTPEERIANYGAKVAAIAQGALEKITSGVQGELDVWTETVVLPPRKPNGWFLLAAMQLGLTGGRAKELVQALMPEKTTLAFLRLGDTLWIGMPCEPTGAIGMAAKRAARQAGAPHPAIVALTNDWLAYCLTPEQYRAGSYEASMSFYGDALGPALLAALQSGLKRVATLPAGSESR